ncbi:MAG TPA: ATP-binding protein, partial [Syntrophales bacterium]|nr:ATP-binding protein [Syntrophales bacterium]
MEALYYTLNPWWEGKEFAAGIDRDAYLRQVPIYLQRRQMEIFIGSRRTGKTTLLKQIVKNLLSRNIEAKDIIYLALDHPRLSFAPLSEHVRNFRKLFMHDRGRKIFLFLDEVQDSPQWEAELKALYDLEEVKIFCSGSTSTLLTRQEGKLTGRQIVTTIFTLSFPEYLQFRGLSPSLSEDYKYESLAEEYLSLGGYPEQVLHPSQEYLLNLLDDILARDLTRLHSLKKPFLLKELLRLIAAAAGSRTSFNKLAKVLGISVDTVKEYIGYFEMAFLIKSVEKWTTSWSEKIYAQKKIYLWDLGVKSLFTGSGDLGSKAENAVLIELLRSGISGGYFAESEREVDFVMGTAESPLPLEVKYLESFDWQDKRFAGLRLFLKRFPATRKALVVTKGAETTMEVNGVEINALPLWKFLLSRQNKL